MADRHDEAASALDQLARGTLRAAREHAYALFDRAWPAICLHLAVFQRSLGVPREVWEDCGQAALLRVWKSRLAYRGSSRGELLAWLFRICQREHLRAVSRAGLTTADHDDDEIDCRVRADDVHDPTTDEVARRERRAALEACLSKLDERQRTLVELLYSPSALTEREVARMIDLSKSRVNALRQEALAKLERCMRRGGEP